MKYYQSNDDQPFTDETISWLKDFFGRIFFSFWVDSNLNKKISENFSDFIFFNYHN